MGETPANQSAHARDKMTFEVGQGQPNFGR